MSNEKHSSYSNHDGNRNISQPKKNSFLTSPFIVLFALCFLFTTCDLLQPNNPDYYQELLDEVAYANAPYANVSVGIISGSLSAAPTEAPREKVGYPFSVQATANAGYGFVGWRVLPKAAWDGLNQQSINFETEFVNASAAGSNALAVISDSLDVSGKASGRAEIKANTSAPIVIVPYATMQPALSSASYPAMNAQGIYYENTIELRFDAPVTAESFIYGAGEELFEGDIKNITISAVTAFNVQIHPSELEHLYDVGADTDNGRMLKLTLNPGRLAARTNTTLIQNDFEGMKITIALGADIERQGAEGIYIMPRQELVFTTTSASGSVNTRLSQLMITIDGAIHNYDADVSSGVFNFTVPAVYAQNSITVATTTAVSGVNITLSGAVTATGASTITGTATLAKGRNTVHITTAQAGSQSTYNININNYPSPTPSMLTLTPAINQLTASWTAVTGASGYYLYNSTINDPASAQKSAFIPDPGTPTITAPVPGAPGSTLFVWVQAAAGIDPTTQLESPTFSVNGNSARIQGSNNTLSALSVDSNSISPSFFYNTENYELVLDVENTPSDLTFNFTKGDNGQTVKWGVNTTASTTATGTSFVVLGTSLTIIGMNTLNIEVTSDDGTSTKNYKILIYRKPATPTWAATPFTNFNSEGSVTANWNSVSGITGTGGTGYEVYRNTNGTAGSGGTSTPATSTSVLVGGLSINNYYYFWVRAYKTEGGRTVYSAWSEMKPWSTAVSLNSFTILVAGASYNTGGNTAYNMDLPYATTHTLAVTINPTSAAAAAVSITAGSITGSGSSFNFTGTSTNATTKQLTSTGNITWGTAYSTSFTVKVQAQHTAYEQTYLVTVTRPTTVSLSGSTAVRKPSTRDINLVTVTARRDSHTGTILGTANATATTGNLGTGSTSATCTWTINAMSANTVGVTRIYWTVSIFDTDGYMYTIQTDLSYSAITTSGVSGVSRPISIYGVTTPTGLTGGTLSAMKPAYQTNETVTLIPMPNTDYIFVGTPSAGGRTVTKSGNNFTFTIASADITVTTDTANRFMCTDATLSDITLTNTTSMGTFSPSTTNYSVYTNATDTASVVVTPVKKGSIPYGTITVSANSGAAQTFNTTGISNAVNTGRNIIAISVTPEAGGSPLTYTITVNKRPGKPELAAAYTGGIGYLSNVNLAAPVSGAGSYETYYNTTGSAPTDYAVVSTTVNTILGTSGSIGTTGQLSEGSAYIWVRAKTDEIVGQWSAVKQYYVGVPFNNNMLNAANGAKRYIAQGTYPIASGHNPNVSGTVSLIPVGAVTLQRQSSYLNEIFYVGTGNTLNLNDTTPAYNGILTIDGGMTSGILAKRAAIVVGGLAKGGTCNIYSGVIIQNNSNTHGDSYGGDDLQYYGGGILITDGNVTMSGGIIQNNAAGMPSMLGRGGGGGGVAVFAKDFNTSNKNANATFTFNSGEINFNTSGNYGGGFYLRGMDSSIIKEYATLVINGGSLTGNTAYYSSYNHYYRDLDGGTYIQPNPAALDNIIH